DQLKLRIAPSAGPYDEFWVKSRARYQTDAPVGVWTPGDGAVSAVVRCEARVVHIREHNGLAGLVLETDRYINDPLFVNIVRADAKGRDGSRKIRPLVAQRSSAADARG